MRLETERLILRKPRKSDAKILKKNNDTIAIRDFFMPCPEKEGYFEKLTNRCIREWEKKKRYWFIIVLKKTGKVIGLSGVKNIDYYNKTGYLSSWIFKRYRRKYYLTEAKIAIHDFCFNDLGLRKLKSEVATFNKPSINMQAKFGITFEGMKRKENLNPYTKKYTDMNLYGILKPEWKKVAPGLKKDLKKKIDKLKG
ncbi:MAG: GNAT family protein [Nanoarchaeota archaeon]|jgi:RimJ/RimL family protein N-acetyltransferase|nr:GNAT family protein [Nanoarchaeota archaeon]